MPSPNPLTASNSMLLSRRYASSQLGVLRQLSPCVAWQFPNHPWDSWCQATLTSPVWLEISSPVSVSSPVISSHCPSRLSWAWHVAGTQEIIVEWINWKWSPGGRVKKALGEPAIGWTGTLGRWAKCYLTTSAMEHPWLWTYFCLLNGFIPLRTWLQIQMTPLYSCVVLGTYPFLFLLLKAMLGLHCSSQAFSSCDT